MTKQTENIGVEVPQMNTLSDRMNSSLKAGYTSNFTVTEKGLLSDKSTRVYLPAEVTIKDFYRFEGASDPEDNAIMYLIESVDGLKGVLIDAYGAYADEAITKFILEVESINKKT